ncbi:hypothetical protein OG738_02595 [Amycolatopsis sp. NBC_01488]|uniref:hypothetical protein n=1 Tax=Amycolatopsis sp. NBC_01488 TaxID=2903563 RepID=UPI002E2D1027|nr:hypothetical protein [Amycolatopsis sp. NBC_01488]
MAGGDDVEALGARAPAGPVLCAYVPDVGVKDALIADDPAVFFTTPHFRGFPAILEAAGEDVGRKIGEPCRERGPDSVLSGERAAGAREGADHGEVHAADELHRKRRVRPPDG